MDIADEELRETIKMIWPLQARKILDLLVPRNEATNKYNLTVGKIYAGLMVLECWRNTRFGKRKSKFGVRHNISLFCIKLQKIKLLVHLLHGKQ